MYPKVFVDFAEHQRLLRRRQRAADAGLLLRPRARRRAVRRHRARQDAGHPVPGDRRARRRGQAHDLLRAQRPAARGEGARPLARADRARRKRMADEGDPTPRRRRRCRAWWSPSRRTRATGCARGDRLLSIEAMKMETGVFAERDGVVAEVLVAAGTQVETKQLLMVVGDGGRRSGGRRRDPRPVRSARARTGGSDERRLEQGRRGRRRGARAPRRRGRRRATSRGRSAPRT